MRFFVRARIECKKDCYMAAQSTIKKILRGTVVYVVVHVVEVTTTSYVFYKDKRIS